nr:MAG TPA: NinG protein [Caudoviricetes sp.]
MLCEVIVEFNQKMNRMIRSYSEMMELESYEDRLVYLSLGGIVSHPTFGGSRYLNQALYRSYEWRAFRNDIIIRDNGCDLACEDFPINDKILIHHINPLTLDDIKQRSRNIFDPDNVVCVSHLTHEAIHYGTEILNRSMIDRTPNDTTLWK